jgi:hypothetical protein
MIAHIVAERVPSLAFLRQLIQVRYDLDLAATEQVSRRLIGLFDTDSTYR